MTLLWKHTKKFLFFYCFWPTYCFGNWSCRKSSYWAEKSDKSAMVAGRTHALTIYGEHPIWWPRSIIVQRHRLLRNLSIHSLQGKVIISLLSNVLPQFRDRKSSRSNLRCVGLMCSFTLIGRLCLSGKWLVVKNEHQNRHVSKEIGLCTQNIDTILGSIVVTELQGPMWSLKENLYFDLT